jgi:hypothetical protein
MKDLQKLITERAEAKLRKDVLEYLVGIRHTPLFKDIEKLSVNINGEDISFSSFFWPNIDYMGFNLIYKGAIQGYI